MILFRLRRLHLVTYLINSEIIKKMSALPIVSKKIHFFATERTGFSQKLMQLLYIEKPQLIFNIHI